MNSLDEHQHYVRTETNVIDMSTNIHPTALVDSSARLSASVSVGPYAIIGPNVDIDENTTVGPHVLIEGWTSIGKRNEIFSGAVIGNKPQDLKFNGEKSFVKIGNDNIIREYATINRGTKGGGGVTSMGNNNLLMTSSHVAHDAIIDDNCIVGHGSLIGGHAIVEKGATVAVLCGVHQYCKVGCYSMIGGGTKVSKDIAPFTLVKGNKPKLRGLNIEKLRRLGVSTENKIGLKKAYNILFGSGLILSEAIKKIELALPSTQEVNILINFLRNSRRGTYR